MPKYQDKEVITGVDRAYEALMMKNADNKDVNARKFVESLEKKYGASPVGTLRFIYNATGNRLTFVASHDWKGHIGDCSYPLLLENGQWGAFLHVLKSSYGGSVAATICRRQDEKGGAFDWMLSWHNSYKDSDRVYTEIREADQFNGIDWSSIHHNNLRNLTKFYHHYSSATLNGCYSTVITGNSDDINSDRRISPTFEGIMTQKCMDTMNTSNEICVCSTGISIDT